MSNTYTIPLVEKWDNLDISKHYYHNLSLFKKKPIRCNPKYSINSIFVRVISLELYVCLTFSLVGILAAQDHSLSKPSTGVAKMTEGGWQLLKPQQGVAPGPQCLTNLSFSIRP